MRDNRETQTSWARLAGRVGAELIRIYNRHEIATAPLPSGPVLFVANHGFGGVFDLNVLAFGAAYEHTGDSRGVVTLTHQMAWTLGIGRLLEPFGARPAGRQAALDALAAGDHVLVFPGGDVDAFKPWAQRNDIVFAGRYGFARVAMDAGVPVVPVVTSGGAESAIVLDDGTLLARALKLDRVLRLKCLPVTVSVPWGLTIATAGLLPYLPLPTKLRTTVLPAMRPQPGDDHEAFARRIEPSCRTSSAGRPAIAGRSWADEARTGRYERAHARPVS
ncbi:1-acyl-sn-glycerol-3-phosphate acyltransferase [Nocardia violaceofusca]|uniref:1-acyl-sn-glycerol-3-phosphate acyltransferase n=1 Tax=Nocardia violaceofusca TaxID=941182 RepID=UPI0007C7DBE2|nr:1-acyl-sn-glycerol-3-phosphate acyltransferase [Nocardia violaceofusca]